MKFKTIFGRNFANESVAIVTSVYDEISSNFSLRLGGVV